MPQRPTLYLIDGHAVAYRQYYAFARAAITSPDGMPTGAVFGFTRVLLDILEKQRPQYLAVSFDRGLSGREDLYAGYKGQRSDMPDDLVEQMEQIYAMVAAFNIPLLAVDGYEADDVIGTVTSQALDQELDVHIVTGDRDLLQLLSPHVRVELPSRGKQPDEIFDELKFQEKYQLRSSQLVDLKALMGDSSDNIPGVAGIGEKGGTRLLQDYGDLDTIYANLESIAGATHKKLLDGRDMAYLSRDLATIRRSVPIQLQLEKCVTQDFNHQQVEHLFRQLGFRNLFDRLQNLGQRQLTLFMPEDVMSSSSASVHAVTDYEIVRDAEALTMLVERLQSAEAIVWDVETTSTSKMEAELVGIALAVDADKGYYIPVGHEEGQQLPLDRVIDALRGPLTDPSIPKIAHNATYDLVVTQRYGIDVQPVSFDTMIAEWLRDPASRFLGLKNFARQYLGLNMTEIDTLLGKGSKQISMSAVSIAEAGAYAAADAAVTMRAADYLRQELESQNLMALFDTLDMPMIPVIAAIEQAGVALDLTFLADMSQRLGVQLDEIEDRIHELSDGYGSFNINSPKQLNDVLFGQLRLPVEGLRKTSHGYSTDVTSLEALRDQHPIVSEILNYRELSKLKGTYVDALPELVNPHTGRLHTSYNQTGTTTGRFSSSDPNLQNIPIRTEQGREVRRAFVAPPGMVLLAVDYSQIELRVMAHISEDETLMRAFEAGQDIHRATAAAVYGITPDDVTYEQRSFAKRVNFGLMYGMGARRLALSSELTFAEAQHFVDTYFERLPGVLRYIESTKQMARDHGYVETLFGRRRAFPAMHSGRNNQAARSEERAAINMPIQGTAADILKKAMITLHGELAQRSDDARMILQVHDELVLEVPESSLAAVAALVVDVMQSAYPLRVPLVANAQVGPNWRDMTDL